MFSPVELAHLVSNHLDICQLLGTFLAQARPVEMETGFPLMLSPSEVLWLQLCQFGWRPGVPEGGILY